MTEAVGQVPSYSECLISQSTSPPLPNFRYILEDEKRHNTRVGDADIPDVDPVDVEDEYMDASGDLGLPDDDDDDYMYGDEAYLVSK